MCVETCGVCLNANARPPQNLAFVRALANGAHRATFLMYLSHTHTVHMLTNSCHSRAMLSGVHALHPHDTTNSKASLYLLYTSCVHRTFSRQHGMVASGSRARISATPPVPEDNDNTKPTIPAADCRALDYFDLARGVH